MDVCNKLKRVKRAVDASISMNMLEPCEYFTMHIVVLLLLILALYGSYWFLPSHLRHLAYLMGLASTDL